MIRKPATTADVHASDAKTEGGSTRDTDAATRRRRATTLLMVFAITVVAAMLSIMVGSVPIAAGDVVRFLAEGPGAPPASDSPNVLGGARSDASMRAIVWRFRLPKALTACLAGAALAVSGLLMQTVFRNPLAGPYVLGISAGASLGVALVVLAAGSLGAGFRAVVGGSGGLSLVLAATLGAASVLGLVLMAARRVSPLVLLILGVLFGYAAGSVVTVLLHLAAAENVQAYVMWTFGSFGGVAPSELRYFMPAVLVGLALAATAAKPLDALAHGADLARSMGVRVGATRTRVVIATALLAGSVTAFCGPIGFLGVAVPHLARGLLRTGDHRWLLPACVLIGAAVALVSDLVAQLPGQEGVLPLNAVTALVGAPILAWVVLRSRGSEPWA